MTTQPSAINEAANRLQEAIKTHRACPPVRSILADGDLGAAYAVQNILTEQALKDGRRLVGRKIGLTSPAVQKQLGVDQPDYGMLFADMDVPQGLPITLDRVLQPKIEAEIAFILKNDLDGDDLTTADVLSSVGYAVAALEIVGSRIENWDISIIDTIADNASSGLFTLGHDPHQIGTFDMRGCEMTMKRTQAGETATVSSGTGADCLGSPVSAALWLAKVMSGAGRPLKKGDVILSGALGPMVAVEPGDVFEASISGLGSVRAEFAGEST